MIKMIMIIGSRNFPFWLVYIPDTCISIWHNVKELGPIVLGVTQN